MSWCWYCSFLSQILYFTQFLTWISWLIQLVLSLKPYIFVTKFLNSCSVLSVTYAFHIFLHFSLDVGWGGCKGSWNQGTQGIKDHGVSKEHHAKCSARAKGSEMIYIFQEVTIATGSNPHRVFVWYHYSPLLFWDWDCNTEEKLETMVAQNFGG